MSLHVIRMPDLGEGIAEVELVAWHVKPGDIVAEDQILVDVMTDKATIEVPSSVAGRVLALGGEVGQTLAVGAELIRIEQDGGPAAAAAPAAAAVVPAASPAPAPTAAPAKPPAAPPPQRTEAPAAPAVAMAGTASRVIASPSVRARAWELGIDLVQVRATGTAGRIVHADLDAFVAAGSPRGPARAAPPVPASAPMVADRVETIKVVGLRRKIAQRMQDAKRRIPHFAYVEEVDVSEVEALREHLNARWQAERGHLTPLAFIVRAIVLAAAEVPQVNAHFDDEAGVLTRHGAVHAGVATQTDAGLLVPVLRDAQALGLWQVAAEAARIAVLARSGKASRGELSGSTITVTSLGKLGGIASTPVINAPEVAIVGVNRIAERAVVRGGAIVVRRMMNLSSSFDHRVVDGAVAAAFIQRVREMLEHPATLFIGDG